MANKDEYTMHCCLCQTADDLKMVAQRVDSKMVGWVFVCSKCSPEVFKGTADVNLMRSEKTNGQ